MKKIEICAMKRDRKAILEKLQSLGMVEIQTDNEETDDFRKMSTTSQRAKYEKRVQNTDEALQIIDKYAPEEKSIFASLEERQEASEADIQEIIAGRWDYNRKVKKIQEISKDIAGWRGGNSQMSGGYRRIGAVAEYGHTDQYHRDREDGCDDRNYATGAHGDGYSGVVQALRNRR